MILQIARASVEPSKLAEHRSLTQEVVDALKRLPGLQHAYDAEDAESGRLVVVTIWDTREHARFDPSALGDLMERGQQLGVQMEAPEFYEITAQS